MRAIDDIISIIIILSLSIWSWGGNAQHENITAPTPTGSRLRLEWPAAFCNLNPTKCATAAKSIGDFTIHGLWPYDARGNSVIPPCGGTPFNGNSIKGPLRRNLNEYWPNINRDFASNEAFWKYQWDKHGICSESREFTQNVYFQKAINLINEADVLGALNQEGIRPDGGKTYAGKDIIAAIKNNSNAKPELVCLRGVLLGVNLCVNKPATQFLDCPASADCVSANLKFIPPAPPASVSLYTPI